jgi:hypothetical protein
MSLRARVTIIARGGLAIEAYDAASTRLPAV